MTKQFVLLIVVFQSIHWIFMDLVPNQDYLDKVKSHYGDDYGTKWIYFPDDDGVQHYIDLTTNIDNMCDILHSQSNFIVTGGIEYRLHNRNDTRYILLDKQGRAINTCDQNITTETLQSGLQLKIITHGWRSSADVKGVTNIKNEYLLDKNVNVITIDWSYISRHICYIWVTTKIKDVGTEIASFLDGLSQEYNVTGDLLHLIGHSLGAHVMGVAASRANSKVFRVTGLDPARPFFEFPRKDPSERLDSSDAEIVDVIHTCAGFLGFANAVGTVDFFPNAGVPPQPGCEGIFKYIEACSHSISYNYFWESIKYPTIYPAYECPSWYDFKEHRCTNTGYMGDLVYRNMSGKYYLRANAS